MTSLRRLQSLLSGRTLRSVYRNLHSSSDAMIVNVREGALRGRYTTSKDGGNFFSFQGIPYAQPPLGPLRFKAPKPPLPWSGVRDALEEGNICPQIEPMINEFTGDEDCLFLNVFTTQVPEDEASQISNKKAVMVFIHGGGFAMGSGNSAVYGPDFLVDQGVVVVTFNYRVGPFGFLSTEDGEIPGNAGLKDQVAALRWVQQNIARFGGDPGNVTIFGESAGGASVHYHMLSPMSKGLFHRAISQSGSALNCWAFSRNVRSRTVRLAKALGCKSESSRDVLAFLKNIPANRLVDNQNLALSNEEKRRAGELCLPFVPTSEGMVDSKEEKFLIGEPIDIIKSGNFTMVPYITGVNSNEGLLILKDIIGKQDVLKKIDNDFERLLPEDMFPEIDSAKSKEASQKVKKFFFGNSPLCEETLNKYADLKSDTLFLYMVNKTVELHALKSTTPIYYYQFAFDGLLGLFKHYVLNSDLPGVAHADELGYIFHPSLFPVEFEAQSTETKVRSMMVKMWTDFAKTGDPNADVTWQPVSPTKAIYLRIDEVPTMMDGIEKRRMAFWDELYQMYQRDHIPRKTSKL